MVKGLLIIRRMRVVIHPLKNDYQPAIRLPFLPLQKEQHVANEAGLGYLLVACLMKQSSMLALSIAWLLASIGVLQKNDSNHFGRAVKCWTFAFKSFKPLMQLWMPTVLSWWRCFISYSHQIPHSESGWGWCAIKRHVMPSFGTIQKTHEQLQQLNQGHLPIVMSLIVTPHPIKVTWQLTVTKYSIKVIAVIMTTTKSIPFRRIYPSATSLGFPQTKICPTITIFQPMLPVCHLTISHGHFPSWRCSESNHSDKHPLLLWHQQTNTLTRMCPMACHRPPYWVLSQKAAPMTVQLPPRRSWDFVPKIGTLVLSLPISSDLSYFLNMI